MKKYILTIALAAFNITAFAQTVNIHFKNGQTIKYSSANVDYVDFSEKASDPALTAGTAVDLGLSVYWASCNLGAESPSEYGGYYAWGETKTKNSYTQENYSYYDNSIKDYISIGNEISGTEYDAATVNLGNDWRMPTKGEIEELINNCSWEWTQLNNVNGYVITGKNGNSIFLPASGYYEGNYIYLNYEKEKSGAAFRSSTHYITTRTAFSQTVWYCRGGELLTINKYAGLTIRPVTSNSKAGGDLVDHSQDHFVTDKISASFTGGSVSSINGLIMAGSVLNVSFTNGSDKPVTLVGVQINDAANGYESNNVLDAEVEVSAGETKSYSIRLGKGMTTPVVRFTYRYNKKKYTAEATWKNTQIHF